MNTVPKKLRDFYPFILIESYGPKDNDVKLKIDQQSFTIASGLSKKEAKWWRNNLAVALERRFEIKKGEQHD